MQDDATRYLHVRWNHELPDEPVVILSELVGDQEVRKVEQYADGRVGWAGPEGQFGGSALSFGEGAIPSGEEIAADPQFTVLPIDGDGFEREWRAATGA